MSIVPSTRLGKVEFYEAHIAPWTTNAVSIGLTAAQVADVKKFTEEARAAYNAQQMAADAAKAATEHFYNCVSTMHGDGSDAIRAIKNKAETTGDPNVYVLAQIPAPTPPGPTPPPGTSSDMRVELLADGSLGLSWKCQNPEGTSGTIYEVQRRIGPAPAPFVYVGATGLKSFTDDTLPIGSSSVMYQITAVRSTARGNPAWFVVNFGVSGDGKTVQQVASADSTGAAWNIEIPAPLVKGQVVKANGRAHANRKMVVGNVDSVRRDDRSPVHATPLPNRYNYLPYFSSGNRRSFEVSSDSKM